MIRQNLSQKMLQKLSPQQIQLMKLLQVPTMMLEERIKEELELNPALEEGDQRDEGPDMDAPEPGDSSDDDFDVDAYLTEYMDDDPSTYASRSESPAAEETDRTIPIPVENSFHEYLLDQLQLLEFADEREEIVARQVVGSIDDDGYLRRDPEAILDDLLFSQNVLATVEEVNHWLQQVQGFEPPGVGARDLQECLAIQLRLKLQREQLPELRAEPLRLALNIIEKHFDEFSKKHYDKLLKEYNLEPEDLREAMDEILRLNPKPASGYNGGSSRTTQYITPDFILTNTDEELELNLHARNAPDLRVNQQYKEMLQAYQRKSNGERAGKSQREAVTFIKQKIDSARWFIDAIRQRQDTMYRTMYAIMQYQRDFFLTGDEKKMRPMILKDIADLTGLDISTISRVANSKFVQTEFGVKSLKSFFSESMQTQDGEEVSTLEVKKILSEVIEKENKRKPHSDEKLTQMLQDKGYNIARRTVAKYREQLNIPVARLRKEF
jgi:RNA polymerase sigma-54 factor